MPKLDFLFFFLSYSKKIPVSVLSNTLQAFTLQTEFLLYVSEYLSKRAILKNGECNIVQSKLSQKRLRFLQDIFTTFVDTQWREYDKIRAFKVSYFYFTLNLGWTLLTFGLSFM